VTGENQFAECCNPEMSIYASRINRLRRLVAPAPATQLRLLKPYCTSRLKKPSIVIATAQLWFLLKLNSLLYCIRQIPPGYEIARYVYIFLSTSSSCHREHQQLPLASFSVILRITLLIQLLCHHDPLVMSLPRQPPLFVTTVSSGLSPSLVCMQTLDSVIITIYVLPPRKSPRFRLKPAEGPSLGPTGPVWHLLETDSISH
jgi:hypothetical protein